MSRVALYVLQNFKKTYRAHQNIVWYLRMNTAWEKLFIMWEPIYARLSRSRHIPGEIFSTDVLPHETVGMLEELKS